MTTLSSDSILSTIIDVVCDKSNTNLDDTINWEYVRSDVELIVDPHTIEDKTLMKTTLTRFINHYTHQQN